MKAATDERAKDDPRVLEAAREYLAELEAGRQPSRQDYLARHPDLAKELAECFAGIELAQTLRPPAATPQPEFPANPLGDFQILRQVGSGGMGVVYEAVQLSLGRRVALKVLPFAAALDAKHLQRFKTEAHAAAQLHHTNIVPVYAVGCERGVHFYAMQLIEGRSLDTVIRDLRGDGNLSALATGGSKAGSEGKTGATTGEFPASSGTPRQSARLGSTAIISATARTALRSGRGRESYRTAAQVAAQVADALQYAHDAGVVHRDIKPANLLLDAKGTVWVTDFGLAHVTADVSLTQSGDLVGTLRYMSPEQAAGQRVLVDHRTDVYSLGATLYELLTLAPIFSGQDRHKLLHQILNEEPLLPRQVDRSIPVELETIVLKALAKSPADRYLTAGEMAADLRRFLDERPILARRPSFVERTRKWMRRHPSVLVAGVVLLVLLAAGSLISAWLIQGEQARTQAAYDRERQRAREAEERFQLAKGAVDDLIEMAEQGLADQPHLESLRKRLLESALDYYQKFIEQRREDPSAQAELAVTHDRVKRIVDDLAVLQGAWQHFLLSEPAVLVDLRVSAEQQTRLSDWQKRRDEKAQETFKEFLKITPRERKKRFLEAARGNEAAIGAILSADQLGRLRQIALQARGPAAFRDPEVARELMLTSEQREKIQSIEFSMFFGKGFRPGAPPEMPVDQARKSSLERIREVLTQEQARHWNEMIGATFEGPLPQMFGFFPGKGPPPPGKNPGKGGFGPR